MRNSPNMSSRMKYEINGSFFSTKSEIEDRCRLSLNATVPGNLITEDYDFLVDLFQFHDEWHQKTALGFAGISTAITAQGTKCFVLVLGDGSSIDISFKHATKCIQVANGIERLPQALFNFRSAARSTIDVQIREFRDQQLVSGPKCPISNVSLTRANVAVDHYNPSFDELLFEFCKTRGIDPTSIQIGSKYGTIPYFEDESLASDWYRYHQENANLRVVEKKENLKLPKQKANWKSYLNGIQNETVQ